MPLTVAFQLLVMRLAPLYCQLIAQLLIGLLLSLVMRMEPVNPLFHSLLIKYWQLACAPWAKSPSSAAEATNRYSGLDRPCLDVAVDNCCVVIVFTLRW